MAPGATDPIAPIDGATATLLTAEPTTAGATTSATPTATANSTGRPSRRAAIARRLLAVVRPTAVGGLFVLGIAIGAVSFQTTRPARPLATSAEALFTTPEIPPAVQSLVAAMRADDRKMMATIVPTTPYAYLAGELAQWDVQNILNVEVLASFSSARSTATELVMVTKKSDGSLIATNLIVELQNGVISGFR
jgi:hypothetical protein